MKIEESAIARPLCNRERAAAGIDCRETVIAPSKVSSDVHSLRPLCDTWLQQTGVDLQDEMAEIPIGCIQDMSAEALDRAPIRQMY